MGLVRLHVQTHVLSPGCGIQIPHLSPYDKLQSRNPKDFLTLYKAQQVLFFTSSHCYKNSRGAVASAKPNYPAHCNYVITK